MRERPRGDTSAAGRCCDERLVYEPIARAGAEGQPVTDRAMFEAALSARLVLPFSSQRLVTAGPGCEEVRRARCPVGRSFSWREPHKEGPLSAGTARAPRC